MTSEPSPEPDPRKKRALIIAGAIAVGAILWNVEDWSDNDPPVVITVDRDEAEGDPEAIRSAIRDEIREEIRAGIHGDAEPDEEESAANEPSEETDQDVAASQDVSDESGTGERRLVEMESGENQRSFRIEGSDGRGVTISVDGDSAN